jgi:hypothetical protein
MKEAEWTEEIAKLIVGKTITQVEYMSEELADEWGWYKRPLMIRLSDGHQLIISQDDEGNDGGAVFTTYDAPLSVFPVM